MGRRLIFVSSTSDLRSARDLVAKLLISLGYEPMWQDIESTEGGELLQVLRKRIDRCGMMVQLVGRTYGAEPPTPPAGMKRCSYTQFEAKYAESVGIKVVYVWLSDDFPVDRAVDEPAELRAMQDAYREDLTARNVLRHDVATLETLENRILRLRADLEELRAANDRRARRLILLSSMGVVLMLALIVLVWWQSQKTPTIAEKPSWLTTALEEAGVDRSSITKDDFKLAVRPFGLSNSMQGRVDVEVSARLRSLASNGGLEVRAGEGPWRTVYNEPSGGGGYMAMLDSSDLTAGPPLQVRIDSSAGPGVGDVIGPFTYDIDAGKVLRDGQVTAVRGGANWISFGNGRWTVDPLYFRQNADAMRAIRLGNSETTLDHRVELPARPAVGAAMEDGMRYTANVGVFSTKLQMEILERYGRGTFFSQFELADGTITPVRRHEGGATPEETRTNDLTQKLATVLKIGNDRRERRKVEQIAARLQGDWIKDDSERSGTIAFDNVWNTEGAVKRIHLGGASDKLEHVIEFVPKAAGHQRSDPYAISIGSNGSFPILPGWDRVFVQLELADGSKLDTREYKLKPNDALSAELPATEAPQGVTAPRLFAAFRGEDRSPTLLALPPRGTTEMRYLVDGRYATFGSGGWWTRYGRGYDTAMGDQSLKIIYQLADGSELGPITYDIKQVKELQRAAYEPLVLEQKRELIAAQRFVFDARLTTPEDRRYAYIMYAANAMQWHSVEPISEPATVVYASSAPFKPPAWMAVKKVRVGADAKNLTKEVEVNYVRPKQGEVPWPGWHAILPADQKEVFVQLVFHSGREGEPFSVPIAETTVKKD